MYGYIYLTTNLITGKKYIGKHRSTTFEPSYLGSGKYLKNTISKYGRENFTCEILEWCETLRDLNDCEIKWISQLNAVECETFYNLAPGGEGHTAPHSMETRKQMSDIKKGKAPGNKGKTLSDTTREKMRQAKLGHTISEETRRKMSEAKIGKQQTEAHIQKLSEARKGKHRSEETKRKMSEAHKARLSKLLNTQ
jgi:group I intron endonuclease